MKYEVRTNKITDKINVRVRSVSRQDHFPVMSQNHHHYNQHQYRRNCMPELGSYCSDYAACRMMRDSNPGKDNFIFFKKTSGRALGSTQPPDQWVSDSFPGIKRSGYEVFQKASMYCRGYERVELTLCSLYIPSWHGQGHL